MRFNNFAFNSISELKNALTREYFYYFLIQKVPVILSQTFLNTIPEKIIHHIVMSYLQNSL